LDGELVAVDGGDIAVAEFLVKGPGAIRRPKRTEDDGENKYDLE
jgi:hypothetical protein